MMNILFKILNISSLLLAALLFSCEKIIDVNINDSDPQIVAQANVSDNGKAKVILTKSINFDETNEFPEVENAIVVISDDNGNSEKLIETEKGVYTSNTINTVIGETYYLNIKSDETTLTSFSKIPKKINFDGLFIVPGESFNGPGQPTEEILNIFVKYEDPVDEDNFYRFKEYINGKMTKTYFFDDLLTNGSTATTLLRDRERDLNSGDTLRIEMQCLDKSAYDYFSSFGLNRGPNSSTPANAVTNIEGSQLGYFSAHTFDEKIVVIR